MAGRKRKEPGLYEWIASPALESERKKEARRKKAKSKRTYAAARKLRASPAYPFARNIYRYERKHGEDEYYAKKDFRRALYNPDLYETTHTPSGKPRSEREAIRRYREWEKSNVKRKDPKRVAAGKKAAATRKARGH